MAPATQPDWNLEDEFFCAHCLTALDHWVTRCHRCNHFFDGSDVSDLMRGRPHIASAFHIE
ncbi:hypothetical protein MK489_13760 [Myxococcota bacterium]|nr:hypothetical protein [Myxococcota bacterium]